MLHAAMHASVTSFAQVRAARCMRPAQGTLACCLAAITALFLCVSVYLTPSNGGSLRRFSHVDSSKQHPVSAEVDPQHTASPSTNTSSATDHGVTYSAVSNLGCKDENSDCATWRDRSACISNPAFMLQACRQSCGLCQPSVPIGDQVTLNNGLVMPSIGFGTAGLGEQTSEAVQTALLAGYCLFDTAQAPEWYREDLVGKAIQETSIPRTTLFLTTKLHPQHHGFNSTLKQMQTSFDKLRTEYLDLVLLHYPRCWRELCGDAKPEGTWQDSWQALEQLVVSGQIRSIGVSNFDLSELSELWAVAKVKPAVVQRNSDPLQPDTLVRHYARLTGMQYQGYSTLGSQWLMKGYTYNPVLTHPAVVKAAQDVHQTPAQVVLQWALQNGQAVIPRSAKQARIHDNIALNFVLSEAAMQSLDAVGGNKLA